MKKLIALVIAGVVLMQQCVFAAVPQSEFSDEVLDYAYYYDICDENNCTDYVTYGKANDVLADFVYSNMVSYDEFDKNIFDKTNLTNGYVTRGEWAQALCISLGYIAEDAKSAAAENELDDALNVTSPYAESVPNYTDYVPTQYEAAVNTCYKYDIMGGYADNTFRADDNITLFEVCATLMRAENYLSDIMLDMDVDISYIYEALYTDDMDSFSYLASLSEEIQSRLEKVESGELKSDKKFGKDAESAITEYMKAMENINSLDGCFKNNTMFNLNLELEYADGTVDVSSLGADIDSSIKCNDNNELDEMALKAKFTKDMPQFGGLLMQSDEANEKEYEVYVKDGLMYYGSNGYFVMQEWNGDTDSLNSASEVLNLSNGSPFAEYMIRESLLNGNVTSNGDTKQIKLKLDVKKMLSALGIDIDELTNAFTEADDEQLTLTFEPCVYKFTVDSKGRLTGSQMSLSGNCKLDGDIINLSNVKATLNCDTTWDYDVEEIVFPDFDKLHVEDYTDTADFGSIIGGDDTEMDIIIDDAA